MSDFLHLDWSTWVLVQMANIACAVSLASLVGISTTILFWRLSNPLRHAMLVCSLLLAVSCPLCIALSQRFGFALVRLEIGSENPNSEIRIPASSKTGQSLSSRTAVLEPMERTGVMAARHASATARMERVPAVAAASAVDLGSHEPAASTARTSLWHIAASVALCIWVIGICVKLANMFRGALFLRRFEGTCVAVTEARLLDSMRRARERLQLSWSVPLQSSLLAPAPLVIGILRPRVVVPNRIEDQLDDDQLVDVLAHELAHLKRRDHWIGVVQRVATIGYWWNPLVGWVSSMIGDVRERICDDLASATSNEHRYARALVKLAALVAERPCVPAAIGILSFKDNQLKLRISRLLEADRARATALGISGWMAVTLTAVALAAVVAMSSVAIPGARAAADEPKKNEASKAPQAAKEKSTEAQPVAAKPQYRFPNQIKGTITTEDGKPIPQAKVTFAFGNSEKNQQTPFKPQRRLQLTTDSRGQYEVDARDFPEIQETGFEIDVYAAADGFAEGYAGAWYRPDLAPAVKLPELKLSEGRVVQGRVQGTGGQATGAVLLHALASISRQSLWTHRPLAINADGTFSVTVPKKNTTELMFVSDNFAPLKTTVPVDVSQLNNLVLSRGTVVTGRVLDHEGQPIIGCVVVATEDSESTQSAYRAIKTDARGEYRLGPLLGNFKLHLASFASTSDRLENSDLQSEKTPPPVAPIRVTLTGEAPEQKVTIQAGATLTVKGIIRWADGKPAVKCDVTAWSNGVRLDQTFTDKNGRYEMRLPRPIDDISISAIGLLDKDRAFHIAFPVTTAPAKQKSFQFLVMDRLDRDLDDADWELRQMEPAAKPEVDVAGDELSALRRQYELQSEAYDAAESAAKTPEEEEQIYRTQDPRNVIGPRLLALEAKYRGKPIAIESMEWLVQMACSVGNPDIPVSKAREQLVEILLQHYLQHPDLDAFLDQFESGATAKRGEVLLRAALESPHRKVRAAAAYHLASYHWSRVGSNENLQPYVDLLTDDPTLGAQLEHQLKHYKAAIQENQVLDAVKLRKETEQLAEQVRKDYADVSPPNQNYWTYGELAESLLFEMNYLSVGKIAPEIQGTDVLGNPVHLTKLRGKLVVVSFTYGQPDDVAHLQEVMKQFSRDEVVVINVMSSAAADEVAQRIKAGEVTWPVITDPMYGPITRRWNVHGWAHTYVIDANGVIRGKGVPSDWLVPFVRRVLAKKK